MYALIGGAAVIGAAVAFHYASQKAEAEEDTLDNDLEQLGEVQREENGMLKFEFFLKVFQISTFYGKNQFAAQKITLVNQRRDAFKNKNDQLYE